LCNWGRFRIGLFIIVFATLGAFILGALIATQSRAAWLALIMALCVARTWGGWSWVLVSLNLMALGLGIASWPGSIGRIELLASEASGGERLVLWTGALGSIRDHWWYGVGSALPAILDEWYLPPHLTGRFITALNDSLTCAAMWGIPAFGVGISALGSIIAASWLTRGSYFATIGMAIIAAHLTAGQFQAHLFSSITLIPMIIGLIFVLIGIFVNRHSSSRLLRRACVMGCCAGLVLMGAMLAASVFLTAGLPCTLRSMGNLTVIQSRVIRQSPGMALFVCDDAIEKKRIHRDLISNLISSGWQIVLSEDGDVQAACTRCAAKGLHPLVVVSWHQAAVQLWNASRLGIIPWPAVAWDPQGLPSEVRITPLPFLVIATRHVAFVPDEDDLNDALARSGSAEEIDRVGRQTPLMDSWRVIMAWMAAKGFMTNLTY
jgi:hypothetical protein